jgi:hypothetical protein
MHGCDCHGLSQTAGCLIVLRRVVRLALPGSPPLARFWAFDPSLGSACRTAAQQWKGRPSGRPFFFSPGALRWNLIAVTSREASTGLRWAKCRRSSPQKASVYRPGCFVGLASPPGQLTKAPDQFRIEPLRIAPSRSGAQNVRA